MKRLRVGLDSYSLKPLSLDPLAVLDWAARHGAEGVQFSEGLPDAAGRPEKSLLQDIAQAARAQELYLEWGGAQHIPLDPFNGRPVDTIGPNRKAIEQASLLGVKVVRSCSSGLMRWNDDAVPTETLLRETARNLSAQLSLLRDQGIILALETHFEFTTFELVRLFDMCQVEPGDCLGVCLDTMNLLTMLEDPVAAARRVLPWVVSTHIKDGALLPAEEGFIAFPVEVGRGLIDLEKIVFLLSTLDHPVNLSVEDHGGSFLLPVKDPAFRAKFPDLIDEELLTLSQLADRGRRYAAEGRLAVLDRSGWPEVCPSRVAAGLSYLRSVVHKTQ